MKTSNMALNLAPFGRWTLRDKAAQRRLALRYVKTLIYRYHFIINRKNMYINELSESFREECRIALNEEQTKSLSETNNWSHVDRTKVHSDWDALYKKIVLHIDAADPSNESIQKLIAEHYEIVSRFYIPTGKAYIGMALFYSENEGMKSFHTAYHPNMVNFVGDSISFYVFQNLKST